MRNLESITQMSPQELAEFLGNPRNIPSFNAVREQYPKWEPNLAGANLKGVRLGGMNFSRANLLGANLQKAWLANTNLRRANLSKADLAGAHTDWVNLFGANLSEATLEGNVLCRVNLVSANLHLANMFGVNLWRADLTGVDMSEANLEGVNFKEANLTRANLEGVRLDTVKFDGATLKEASGILVLYVSGMSTRGDYLAGVMREGKLHLATGCFWGTVDEFVTRLNTRDESANTLYRAFLPAIEAWGKMQLTTQA